MDSLTKDQLDECRKLFTIFDVNGDNKISSRELGAALRGLRINISEAEVRDLITNVDTNQNGSLEFAEFCKLYADHLGSMLNQEKLLSTLAAFDKNATGSVDSQELRQILTTQGEPLTEAEVDEVFRDAGIGSGPFQYKNLANLLLT